MFLGALSRKVAVLVRSSSMEATGPLPDIPQDDLPGTTNPKTVEALLDNLRRLVAYEEQRLNSLTTRGAALAGFSGVGTAVIAVGSTTGFPLAVKILLVAAAASLVAVTFGVVIGVLATRTATIQSTRQVTLYREAGYQRVSPPRVQVQMIDILIERLTGLREQNHERAAWLNRSARMLVVAVSLAAAAAIVRLFA